VFIEAFYQFQLYPVYIDTKANGLVDSLSRNNAASFLDQVPQANRWPSSHSAPLYQLLLDLTANWVSPVWRQKFTTIFRQD